MKALVICLLLVLALWADILFKYYASLSEKELKRLASSGSTQHQIVYQIIKNKTVAFFWLNLISLVGFSISFALIVINFETYLVALVLVFMFLLRLYIIKRLLFAKRLSAYSADLLLKIVIKTKAYVGWLARFVDKNLRSSNEIKIYEIEDLIELLKSQKDKKINRIDEKKLKLAINTLSFADKTVDTIMIPKKQVTFVDSEELISTVLIDELHQTGHKYFPVYKDTKSNVVGTLDLDDLVEKRMSGKVAWAIEAGIHKTKPSNSIKDVLDIFLKTRQPLFLVVDEEKPKGILRIEDVLRELLETN